MRQKKIKTTAILIFLASLGVKISLGLSIDSCYAMAKNNYPLIRQYALIEKTKEYSVGNASKAYLPQFFVGGQATHQSEATQIPIQMPGSTIEPLSKDQFKFYGEAAEPLTDLLTVKNQKELVKANSALEGQNVEVAFYQLKQRIINLFLGILLADEQITQTKILKKDIQSALDKTNAAIANGIALKSNADLLNAEMLKMNQRITELESNRKGYADMLSLFINQPVNETTVLEKPEAPVQSASFNRPELKIYDLSKKSLDIQRKLVTSNVLPHLHLFFQGGLGRPALNMLSNDLKGYYIGGIRLNWNIGGFYTYGKERSLLVLRQNSLDVQKDIFLFNTNITMRQESSDISKLEALISTDNEIVVLRERIKNTTKNQLENGTATTYDYLADLNAEATARQNKTLHELQLLMAQYSYQVTTGN